jgi:peptidoglycan-N-acetylglucosamine deacetylase
MLNYRKISVLFILILVIVLIIDYHNQVSIYCYPVIILVYTGFLTFGSIYIHSNFYCRVLCSGNRNEKKIALTFDDGPDRTVTPIILDILNKHQIRATFFCIGQKAEACPELIQRLDREGHSIGSHSYSHHFFFDLLSSKKMSVELQKTEDIIHKILNKMITMFRPPYGVTNPPLAKALKRQKYQVIGWSLRSMDTAIKNEEQLLESVQKNLRGGDIILFHDTQKITAQVLEKFIIFAEENNYSFEPVEKLLGIEPYE